MSGQLQPPKICRSCGGAGCAGCAGGIVPRWLQDEEADLERVRDLQDGVRWPIPRTQEELAAFSSRLERERNEARAESERLCAARAKVHRLRKTRQYLTRELASAMERIGVLMNERDQLHGALQALQTLCDMLVARMASKDATKHIIPLIESHKAAAGLLADVETQKGEQ